MTPYPYSVLCQTETCTSLSYVQEWYPSLEAATDAVLAHKAEGWDSIELVMPGQVPGASVTGRQVLACGGHNLPRRQRHSKKGV